MKIDALQKYQNQLLSAFNAEQLQYLKYDNWTGLLTETDRLYATMFHDWDVLQKDSSDLAEAVQSLEWTVAPYVADGKEADAKAQEVAKTVTDALWKRSSKLPGTYSHTFPQLLNALVHALFRGFNVHEIEWVNDGELVYPAAFHQLPPQFMRWEDRAGELDRLLFVADGETAKPKPFPANKYIVALNTSGPDHPLYNAMYYSLIAWYGAYKFGLGWFMEYCQKYGMPKLVFHYESDRDRQQLEADLAEERVLNNILLKGDRGVDIANAPASGASLPQRELLNLAESQCHKLILGQTLTSDTSEHGGSLAQARVHAGVQAEVVKKRAAFVADVLNTQLIPAIVLLNYGTIDVPMPELVFKLPQEGVTLERVQVLKTALEIKGMRIKKSEAYEFMGFAQPAEGDDVFEAASETPQQGGFGAMFGQQPPPGGKDPQKGQQKPEDGKKDDAVSAMNADFIESANPYGCNQYGHEWKSKHGENWKPSGRGVNEKPGEKNTENKEPSLQELQVEIDNLKKQVQEGKIKSPAPGSPEYEELKKDGLESRDAYYKLNRRKEEIEKEIESIKRNEKAYKDAGQGADYNLRISTMENALKKVNAEMEANRRNSMKKMIDVFKKVNSDVATTSRTDAPTDPAQEWLAPIKQKFLEARKAGASMADLKKMLLTMHPDTKALAKAFANNILAGFAGESEEVDAANPYGCNQYGEGWRMSHNGRASKAGAPIKKTDPTEEERKQKEEEERQRQEEQQRKEEEERKARVETKKKTKEKHPIGQATTREEAIRETKSLIDGKGRVKWSEDISIEQINEFNETISAMKEKFPLDTDIVKLGSYISEDDDEGAHCEAWSKPNTDDIVLHLELNQDHEYGGVHDFYSWKPYERWEIKQSGGYKRMNVGASKSGISIRAVMLHEYGHALHSRAHIAVDHSDKINASWIKDNVDVGNKWKEVYATAVNNGDIVKISEYAAGNDSEFFAECFAARELGEKLPDYINTALDNVINLAIKKP